MRRPVAIALIVAAFSVCPRSQAALSPATNQIPANNPLVIGGKITIFSGARVVIRNVADFDHLPQITVRANGYVVIDGSSDATPAVAR